MGDDERRSRATRNNSTDADYDKKKNDPKKKKRKTFQNPRKNTNRSKLKVSQLYF